MPSVWFINPRIVANLKALATREMRREGEREKEREMVKKGAAGPGEARRKGGGRRVGEPAG